MDVAIVCIGLILGPHNWQTRYLSPDLFNGYMPVNVFCTIEVNWPDNYSISQIIGYRDISSYFNVLISDSADTK